MKRLYYFIVAAVCFLTCATASAQFVNSSASGTTRKTAATTNAVSAFSTFDFTYSPFTLKSEYDGDDETEDMNAVSLNWAKAQSVSTAYPVYLQYGVGLQYAWQTDSEKEDSYSYKSTTSFLTAKIPVNLMYCLNVPNTQLSVLPYAGLNLQGHILGQTKVTVSYDGDSESESMSFFDKDDMDDETFNRFVVGWQIGAKLAFNDFVLGIGYEGPVSNLYKEDDFKINYSLINISIGVKF